MKSKEVVGWPGRYTDWREEALGNLNTAIELLTSAPYGFAYSSRISAQMGYVDDEFKHWNTIHATRIELSLSSALMHIRKAIQEYERMSAVDYNKLKQDQA